MKRKKSCICIFTQIHTNNTMQSSPQGSFVFTAKPRSQQLVCQSGWWSWHNICQFLAHSWRPGQCSFQALLAQRLHWHGPHWPGVTCVGAKFEIQPIYIHWVKLLKFTNTQDWKLSNVCGSWSHQWNTGWKLKKVKLLPFYWCLLVSVDIHFNLFLSLYQWYCQGKFMQLLQSWFISYK